MTPRPSQEQIAYMLAHKNDSLVPNIIAACSICGVASTVFILLRLYSQYLVFRKFRVTQSDILLLIAWCFAAAFTIGLAIIIKYGGGRHVIFVTDPRMLNIWKVCDEVLYTISLGFIKLSILRLYGSIFQSRRFHCCLWTFAVLVIVFHSTASIIDIFECRPIAFSWDTTIQFASCINYGLFVLLTGVVNIITDFIILCAPIPLVLRLQTSKHKKRLLIFTFAMGGSACVVSIIRLGFSLTFDSTVDPSYDNILISILSLIELMAGILATSIPTYRPLFRHIVHSLATHTRHTDASPSHNDNDIKFSKDSSDGSISTSTKNT
ncbi:hypothetical protein F4815DRAFT_68448 [Daldinia loculata]|nr:hypothetical protein F4815DRAFT_68448 [Daldinia loculata]